MEPMLDPPKTVDLVDRLLPYVTDTIWLGLLNKPKQRVKLDEDDDGEFLLTLLGYYESSLMNKIYKTLKNNKQIMWQKELRELLNV
jgi:hypothetical protein